MELVCALLCKSIKMPNCPPSTITIFLCIACTDLAVSRIQKKKKREESNAWVEEIQEGTHMHLLNMKVGGNITRINLTWYVRSYIDDTPWPNSIRPLNLTNKITYNYRLKGWTNGIWYLLHGHLENWFGLWIFESGYRPSGT